MILMSSAQYFIDIQVSKRWFQFCVHQLIMIVAWGTLNKIFEIIFQNSNVIFHFYNAAKEDNTVEFYEHFNQIRDMVTNAVEHLKLVGFHRWSRTFPEEIGTILYIEYLVWIFLWLYILLSHFFCIGIVNWQQNIVKSVNAIFEVKREILFITLFHKIKKRFAKLFHKRRMELINSQNILVSSVEKISIKVKQFEKTSYWPMK